MGQTILAPNLPGVLASWWRLLPVFLPYLTPIFSRPIAYISSREAYNPRHYFRPNRGQTPPHLSWKSSAFADTVTSCPYPPPPRDHGFIRKFWKELWRLLGTDLKIGSGYHPKSSSQAERFNQLLEQTLRCTVHQLVKSSHSPCRALLLVTLIMSR